MRKIRALYDKAIFWIWDNPAKMSALVTIPGDALMMVSGFAMQNWGRIAAGAVGVLSQLPIVLYGDAEAAPDEKIDDPQDNKSHWLKKIYQAVLNPKKYPFEFYSYLNLLQTTLMTTLSGPAWNNAGIQEESRPGEAVSGLMGTVAFGVILLREDEEDFEPEKMEPTSVRKSFLGKAFDVAASPVKDLKEVFTFCSDYALQTQMFGVRDAFNNACHEISKRGPNQVAAKIINYGLVPYATEAIIVQDYATVGAAGIYYLSNIFLKESSKRIYKNPPPDTINASSAETRLPNCAHP